MAVLELSVSYTKSKTFFLTHGAQTIKTTKKTRRKEKVPNILLPASEKVFGAAPSKRSGKKVTRKIPNEKRNIK